MVKITKISIQKRNKSRYNIFLDRGQGEEYAFSVDEDVLIKHRLKKGLQLDEQKLMVLVDEDEQKKAYHLSLHFLSYRMRTIQEVRTYLMKKDRIEHHIETVISQLVEQGLLNDEEFADAYVRTQKATSLKGPKKIEQELRQKGVNDIFVENALQSFSEKEQLHLLVTWLNKQKNKNQKESTQAFINRLTNRLLARGFTKEIIFEALKIVDLAKEKDNEWAAICHQGEKAIKKYVGKYDGWEFQQRVKQALYRKGFKLELIDQFLETKSNKNSI